MSHLEDRLRILLLELVVETLGVVANMQGFFNELEESTFMNIM